MAYNSESDTRNTSNGMTPNKAIRRPTNPPVKSIVGDYMKSSSSKERVNVSMDKTSD